MALAAPSLASIYGTAPRLHHALVLGISQSGRSPDVVAVLDDARRQGALTVAITNDPASELAAAAEHVVELQAGPERAVAATKTYLAEIAVIALLSGALAGDARSRREGFPVSRESTAPIGRHLDGCRIGFDLGASDRKVAAVIDGRVVFSEEVRWDPVARGPAVAR